MLIFVRSCGGRLPSVFLELIMPKEDVIKKYQDLSKTDSAGYPPLHCAVYEGVQDDVKVMIEHYSEIGTLKEELSRVSPLKQTGENILHVAMKHPDILELCCQTIVRCDQTLFEKLVEQVDADEDSIFHQIVEFGRVESLAKLMPFLIDHVSDTVLKDVFAKENKHQETAAVIGQNYDDSKTIRALIIADVLKPPAIDIAHREIFRIREIFAEHQEQLSKTSGLTRN